MRMDESRGLLLLGGCLARPYILLRKVGLRRAETRRETPFVTLFVSCDRSQKYLENLVEEAGNGR